MLITGIVLGLAWVFIGLWVESWVCQFIGWILAGPAAFVLYGGRFLRLLRHLMNRTH